ncbi:MAG: hypothetical protein AB1704_14980 [Pseudomonadota bacterium]|jgi:hypothetical protein|uniref:hypothetical protein n=1 Tax=Burkholderiaceae TaxID=119060 RepID=UPI0010F808B3|nr:hypothetical protein [Burkholderia sp. 4M9327F10]
MSFSAAILVFICAACWVAVVLARSGGLRSKGGAQEPQGRRVLRAALEKRGDIPDVRDVRSVRDVRKVRKIIGLRGRNRRG